MLVSYVSYVCSGRSESIKCRHQASFAFKTKSHVGFLIILKRLIQPSLAYRGFRNKEQNFLPMFRAGFETRFRCLILRGKRASLCAYFCVKQRISFRNLLEISLRSSIFEMVTKFLLKRFIIFVETKKRLPKTQLRIQTKNNCMRPANKF